MPRTTHRSKSGTKLYAKRKKSGEFSDLQSYKRAHGSDVKRTSAAERAKRKSTKKKTAKKKASRKRKSTK